MPVPRRSLSFCLAPDTASASLARERVHAWLAELGWSRDEAHDLVYAVSEIVTNAAEHAFVVTVANRPDAPSIWVDCRVEPSDGRGRGPGRADEVRVRVTDNGRWRPAAASGYRGRGLTLAKAFVNGFAVTTGDRGTTVNLVSRARTTTIRRPHPRGGR